MILRDTETRGFDEVWAATHMADAPRCGGGAVIPSRKAKRREGTKENRRAGRGFVHNPGELSAPALADWLVRPDGAASSYSRAVLGASGNLWAPQAAIKGWETRKTRNLRILNNQHFHSPLCNLWKTSSARERSLEGDDGASPTSHRPPMTTATTSAARGHRDEGRRRRDCGGNERGPAARHRRGTVARRAVSRATRHNARSRALGCGSRLLGGFRVGAGVHCKRPANGAARREGRRSSLRRSVRPSRLRAGRTGRSSWRCSRGRGGGGSAPG
jgi:hypothetical protein